MVNGHIILAHTVVDKEIMGRFRALAERTNSPMSRMIDQALEQFMGSNKTQTTPHKLAIPTANHIEVFVEVAPQQEDAQKIKDCIGSAFGGAIQSPVFMVRKNDEGKRGMGTLIEAYTTDSSAEPLITLCEFCDIARISYIIVCMR